MSRRLELCGRDTDQWEWKPDLSWNRVLLCGLVGGAGPPKGWPGGLSSTSRELFQCFNNWHGCMGEYCWTLPRVRVHTHTHTHTHTGALKPPELSPFPAGKTPSSSLLRLSCGWPASGRQERPNVCQPGTFQDRQSNPPPTPILPVSGQSLLQALPWGLPGEQVPQAKEQ